MEIMAGIDNVGKTIIQLQRKRDHLKGPMGRSRSEGSNL